MLQAYYGWEDENLWQPATGLGAGMSRRGFVCGAVTGGILACGMATALRQGSASKDATGAQVAAETPKLRLDCEGPVTRDVRGLREETYSKVQELTRRFEARFGSVECLTLTGCDFLTQEGQAKFKATNGMDLTCRPAVRFVVETVASLAERV